MKLLFMFAVGAVSFTLLLDWFIQWTHEPRRVLCDGGEGQTK